MDGRTLVAGIALGLGLVAGCQAGEKRPDDPGGNAQALGRMAATPDQARLWKQLGERGGASGLEELPVVDEPVTLRSRVEMAEAAAPRPPAGLPEALSTGVRVGEAEGVPATGFAGEAKILEIEGERMKLDLGEGRGATLVLHARVRGAALEAKAGETVQLEYRARDDPHARQQVVALRTRVGSGLVSVLETDKAPVVVRIPLFQLIAAQTGQPEHGAMPVEVQVGATKKTMRQGETADFAEERLTVTLVASHAVVGAEAFQEEGPPYAIRLLATPVEAAAAPR